MTTVKTVVAGAQRSWVMWANVAMVALGAVELMSSQLTTLLGPKGSAALMVVGAMVNAVLRFKTTESLQAKGAAAQAAQET